MLRAAAILAGALSCSGAHAWSEMESMSFANDLGMILASEEACGMTYDQAAIQALIETTVPADDMSFASTLSVMTQGQAFSLREMSRSSLAAHCASISRTAKHFGLVPD
ncbi:hypothetical protein [Amaricoccus sp.]|uniref:hypothetical protein n=1 Tax=Amaricoccus sp. TaxID=1872485 RepID=UPI001B53CC3B|nr:hypothetical protein [Amaricoccus sp.]MBP7242348.1 signal recognition particle [Amaricoccus sp.]